MIDRAPASIPVLDRVRLSYGSVLLVRRAVFDEPGSV